MRKEEDQRSNPDTEPRRDELGTAIAMWIPIGAGGGVALGLALQNLALGMAVGAAIGVAVGCAVAQRGKFAERQQRGNSRVLLWLTLGLGGLVLAGAVLLALLRAH